MRIMVVTKCQGTIKIKNYVTINISEITSFRSLCIDKPHLNIENSLVCFI
jgi:hypothetical protein